jgi:hypothetical protein
MGSSSSAIMPLYSPQRLWTRGSTLIGILLIVQEKRGRGHDLFSDRSLQEQAAWAKAIARCEPLLIQADGMNRTCTLRMITTQIMHTWMHGCRASTLGYQCLLSGVHCHNTDPCFHLCESLTCGTHCRMGYTYTIKCPYFDTLFSENSVFLKNMFRQPPLKIFGGMS